jgi:hypothetical protein
MNNNGVWTVLLAIVVAAMVGFQVVDYLRFRTAGPRFTADDGQSLCERVQRMDGLPCTITQR